jgi:hypothetical protein
MSSLRPQPQHSHKERGRCAIIWNKEFNSLTLYKERYHRYRATSSRAVLVGVLGDPSFLPGLFLRHAAGLVREAMLPEGTSRKLHCELSGSVAARSQGWRRCSN